MNQVVITKKEVYSYFVSDAFRPTEKYPEYPFTEYDTGNNIIYDMVRESFQTMGLDILNFNTPDWNPLGCYIKPGDTVLLKPNLVMDNNPSGGGTDCLYTQPSVVAAVIDYVYIALKGKGKIVVGDAPMQECNFEKLLSQSGYDRLINYYKKKCVGGV